MGLYNVPEGFQERLDQEFGEGKIRVRWSDQWDEWHVEQRVRRGVVGIGSATERWRDDVIRYRDGYVWIMSLKQGTRFPCPKCGLTLKAPTRATEMVSCEHCRLKGYDHHWMACHWPMDETLIDHLKELERGIDTRIEDLQQARVAHQKMQQRRVLEPTLAGIEDNFNLGMGIQSVGYTGREKAWIRD